MFGRSRNAPNWAGQPLRTWETLVGYVRGTTTTTGLQVQAQLLEGTYATGERVSDADMDRLNLQRHAVSRLELHAPAPPSRRGWRGIDPLRRDGKLFLDET
ncbi:MAG: hypothetical protein U0531_09105 [Dehalococcoidia bacterium]